MEISAVDDLPDGVLIADAHGAVVQVNQVACALLGRPAAELIGEDFRAVLPLADPSGNGWWECTRPYDGLAIRTRQPERELLLDRPGREPAEVLVTARYVRASRAGPVERLVVCLRDNAIRRRQERGRAELVSTVAHELRSPLTSVKGFTATLLAKWDRFTEDQKKLMLETVNADADRVTRLITELLDVSRLEAGRLELRRQPVDLPARIRRAFNGLIAAGHPEEKFRLEVDEPLPEVWADPDKVDQVLGNLVENAVRHGAGQVEARVAGAGDQVSITIADQGPGIDPGSADRLFLKFWKGERRGGTGLGLYIAKGLVEAHGGQIEAGGAPGGGALFRFTLPAGEPAHDWA